ncbi:MAG: DUF5107 domain-containing protein [Armatimonadetes bacterium]|nr:DUF5107 domain-containing protein [Armatimonadota bacterium]
MAKLTLTEWEFPSADLGPENPHPPLQLDFPLMAHFEGQEVWMDTVLPYRLQDGYGRTLAPRKHPVAVLESDRLKATFLLGLGGRLWSLNHKPSGRELLYVNPVFQPVNIGIRGAWFSGGMEWNMGIFGHCVFTCEPVFAGKTVAPDGGDGIRFWEYERLRGIVWQVDVWLPKGSDFLHVMPRIQNPHAKTQPMYWWTCIAPPEIEEARVLASADEAFEPYHDGRHGYEVKNLADEPDLTYPTRRPKPRDTYFDVPEGRRPWVAQVEPNGHGVLHLSSPLLKGRKQWVWGMGSGGRRWQDWLSPSTSPLVGEVGKRSEPGEGEGGSALHPYIEIQGGLGKRQAEYVPMPAYTDWSWLEVYGPMAGMAREPWSQAVGAVDALIEERFPESAFKDAEQKLRKASRIAPTEILFGGSGWGALENARRQLDGEPPTSGPETPFPDSGVDERQVPFLRALDGAPSTDWDVSTPPGDFVGPEWRPVLQTAVRRDPKDAWAWLQLGVVHFQLGDRVAARAAWDRSYAAQPNGWAVRNLAVLDVLEGDAPSASKRYETAFELLGEEPKLMDEILWLFLGARSLLLLEAFLGKLSPEALARPRARLATAMLALQKGDLAAVRAYFEQDCDLADIRECEVTTSELWKGLCGADPAAGDPDKVPWQYDFRMGVVMPVRAK